MTTPTVFHIMPVNPFTYRRAAITWNAAVPQTAAVYRKNANIWDRILHIDRNAIVVGQLFPRGN